MTCSFGNIVKSITGNFMLISDCFVLKIEECGVRKVIVDNVYMTFPYKIGIHRCIGSCNDKNNPYYKVCLPDIVENISIKSFYLILQKNVLKNISFHQSCKSWCLLDEKVCNNLQKWNKEKCRCECLKEKKCCDNSFFNVVNCSCELRKAAALIVEECKEISNNIKNDCIMQNKTVTLIKKIENCKPFVTSSILFVCISIITTGIIIYFCLKSKNNNVLPY